ncbi:MAG: hypothetical protein JWO82_2497 [Akkermansiaceae bacterium]|nr:hypothetical protein [Akkermansiaceae bacterium]
MPKPIIPGAKAKSHLRVEHDLDDEEIALYAEAAVDRTLQEIGLAGVFREYSTTTSRLCASFPYPMTSVVVEKHDGAGGWTVLVADTDYTVTGDPEEKQVLTIGSTHQGGRFRVTWQAGWATTPAWFTVAALLLLGHYYENRSSIIIGQGITAVEVPMSFQHLCRPHKVILFA